MGWHLKVGHVLVWIGFMRRYRENVTTTHLDVGTRLVRHLHDELAALAVGLAGQLVQDVQVHGGAQIVDVGHEDVLAALSDQLVQQPRVVEGGVDVAVAWRVPALGALPVHTEAGGHGEQRLLVDAGVPAADRKGGGGWNDHWLQSCLDFSLLESKIFGFSFSKKKKKKTILRRCGKISSFRISARLQTRVSSQSRSCRWCPTMRSKRDLCQDQLALDSSFSRESGAGPF